ncbi:hypothetical protein [Pseudomarimonas arenosa]|uniref:Chromosome partition protein Smc n=1 Tax=Pseudomarimonas arenosa TaxID=2774145 RepID=A0AAW3ZQ85_9GAMM|nr:hypothetical protein [Pseudomarimonas arenosa]MBD8527095.1 hypothetical protein [Pseudomarimonas arenosa]
MKYLWKAFVARPFGMPIPPNFFALAAFGLLGVFLSPGFWLLGAGAEVAYLAALSTNKRFRNTVDAEEDRADPVDQRYHQSLMKLTPDQQQRQREVEQRAREIFAQLGDSPMFRTHMESLEQLVWINMKLLLARQAILGVVHTARSEADRLDAQEADIEQRLLRDDLSPELRRSLEQQKAVIDQRQEAHQSAGRRLEHVEAELARIEQQIALIREQALLSTNEEQVGASLDSLTASFNEANRWLSGQRDLLDSFDALGNTPLPKSVLRQRTSPGGRQRVSQ